MVADLNGRAKLQIPDSMAHPPVEAANHCCEKACSRPLCVALQVRDNWGDLPTDWDPNSLHMFVARCAWRVVLEYQRQLHEDVDFSKLDQIRKVSGF
jgi:hypothetical protein